MKLDGNSIKKYWLLYAYWAHTIDGFELLTVHNFWFEHCVKSYLGRFKHN